MNEKYLLLMMKRMEEKLLEYMSAEEYTEFSKEIAKESFRLEVNDMEDSDFKFFVTEHFDQIVSDDFNLEQMREETDG